MADQSIRKDFVDGVHEIFTTLFNNGSESDDGVFLYLLSDKTKSNVYGETKYGKLYQRPKLLVCKANLTPTQGEEDVKTVSDHVEFVVTLKSLQENELGVSHADLDKMRQGIMQFHGTYYKVDNILPKAYIEDVFLMYTFVCSEDRQVTEILVEEPEEPQPPEQEVE